jgi:hypothetical protein
LIAKGTEGVAVPCTSIGVPCTVVGVAGTSVGVPCTLAGVPCTYVGVPCTSVEVPCTLVRYHALQPVEGITLDAAFAYNRHSETYCLRNSHDIKNLVRCRSKLPNKELKIQYVFHGLTDVKHLII